MYGIISLNKYQKSPDLRRFHFSHSSVQFSCSVVSDSLWPHEQQHTRPPCPSPTPGVHPNPCPLSRWCHPTISSSVVPFSPCPQSFPASGQLFPSGGQSTGVSAPVSVLPMNTQDWSPLPLRTLNFFFLLIRGFFFYRSTIDLQMEINSIIISLISIIISL